MRLDHLLSKEHVAHGHRAGRSGSSFRGRMSRGEQCSLVERRLFGLLVRERSSVLPNHLVWGRRGTSSGSGREGQAHCWVLRDRVFEPLRATATTNCPACERGKRGFGVESRPYLENYTVDASIFEMTFESFHIDDLLDH